MPNQSYGGLLERLSQGPVICAEGYIFELERRGYLKAGAYVPEAVLDNPEAVLQLHREFLRAGSDVAVALTYYGHRKKMDLIGRGDELETLNRAAVRLARQAAHETGALVAANICNTWVYEPDNLIAAEEVRRQYHEQLTWAAEEGVDFVLAETLEYVGEALVALKVIKSFGLPAVVNFTTIYDTSKDGYDWVDACRILSEAGADVVGFNCARGPRTALPLAKKLARKVKGPKALVPVPYRTTPARPAFQFLRRRDGNSAYTLGLDQHYIDRQEAAEFALEARGLCINFIGLCCGAGPHHIRAVAEAIGRRPAASRYSADMSQHGLLGSKEVVAAHEKQFLQKWH